MNDDKNVTTLVKAMRRALKTTHHIEVPHSALRASYLQALGENPHAFGKKHVTAQSPAKPAAPVTQPAAPRSAMTPAQVELQLHLACTDPMFGGFDCLALDEDGKCLVPAELDLTGATLVKLSAQVPRIRKYGLPDYAQNPAGWFGSLDSPLALAVDFELDIEDLGDDSGDSAVLVVRMPVELRNSLLTAVLEDTATRREVAEYAGLHYGKVLNQCAEVEQGTLLLRWLGVEDEYWGDSADVMPAVSVVEPDPVDPVETPLELRHIKTLSFDGFLDATTRSPRLRGAFEAEMLSDGRSALLYLDKGHSGRVCQDIWLEDNPTRSSVTYVTRIVDLEAGEALAETQTELTYAQAAKLLDESIEQQLGLQALAAERDRMERSRWN